MTEEEEEGLARSLNQYLSTTLVSRHKLEPEEFKSEADHPCDAIHISIPTYLS